MRTILLSFLFTCSMNLAACASKTPEVSDNQETVITSRTFTQANLDDEATCLERCGYEARGTMYSSCLETGETQQECGSSARLWYRECLQTRCDESALQLDDCRTDCRINAKEQVQQCDVDSIEESECKIQIQSVMRTCIDEC